MAFAAKQPMAVHHRHANGTLASTSVYAPGTAVGERLAYAYGDLATQVTVYACHDQLGSVRRWRTPSKGNWGANEFEPYGEAYAIGAVLAPRDYALHEWDPVLAVYRAPYRNYSPTMTRWTTRDPLGMIDGPNMYGYVGGRTLATVDITGSQATEPRDPCQENNANRCQDCCLQKAQERFQSCRRRYPWNIFRRGLCNAPAEQCRKACAMACLSDSTMTGSDASSFSDTCNEVAPSHEDRCPRRK